MLETIKEVAVFGLIAILYFTKTVHGGEPDDFSDIILSIDTSNGDGSGASDYISTPSVVIIDGFERANAIVIHSGPDIEPAGPDVLRDSEEVSTCYQEITMTEEEGQLLRSILALEATGEPFEGQKAVVEVIFNRVLSPDWPDTVHDVIYQKGQFATVKYLSNPYNLPGEIQDDAISEVLNESSTVLPMDYVFFSRGKTNGKDFVKIGKHQFSRARK